MLDKAKFKNHEWLKSALEKSKRAWLTFRSLISSLWRYMHTPEGMKKGGPDCLRCEYLREYDRYEAKNWKCSAFPNGIPDSILSGSRKHLEPLPRQETHIVFRLKQEIVYFRYLFTIVFLYGIGFGIFFIAPFLDINWAKCFIVGFPLLLFGSMLHLFAYHDMRPY